MGVLKMRLSPKRKMDVTDQRIVDRLIDFPQISNKDIAQSLDIAETTVANRIKLLTQDRIIKPTIQINALKGMYDLVGWVQIHCAPHKIDDIVDAIKPIESVFSISVFMNNPFIFVAIMANGAADLEDVLHHRIGAVPGVDRISMDVSLGEVCVKAGIAAL